MIHYLILLLAVAMFTAQFAFTKFYGEKVQQKSTQTLVMMVLTSAIGAAMYWCIGDFKVEITANLVVYAVAFAFVMIPYYVLGIKVLSIGSVAIYSMFMMLGGMLLPFAYGLIFLEESITWGKGIGCVVLSATILMQACVQKKQDDTKAEKRGVFLLLCIAIFVINGLTGVIAKAYQVKEVSSNEIGFTVVSCALTGIFAVLLLIPSAIKDRNGLKEEIKKAVNPVLLLCAAAIGVFAHTGNFMLLKAAAHLPASIQFPMVSGGVIVFSAIVSVGLFKERMCKAEFLCVLLACLSTVLFAF